MSNNKYTHTGLLRGCDNRTPTGFSYPVRLRKTKLHWITHNGQKYNLHGRKINDKWPMYFIDLSSIKDITETGPYNRPKKEVEK